MAVKVTKDNLVDLLIDSTNAAKQRSYFDNREEDETPQSTGGFTYDAPKVSAPVEPKSYESPRMTDFGNVANGSARRTSATELATIPKSFVANFVDQVEKNAKAPFENAAYKLLAQDSVTPKRVEEGGKSVQEGRKKYVEQSRSRREETANKLVGIADNLKLYDPKNILTKREDEMTSSSPKLAESAEKSSANRKSVYDFIEETARDQEKARAETGASFTLADAAAVAGRMAPSQITAALTAGVVGDYALGSDLGRAMSYNLGDSVKAADATKGILNPILSVDDLFSAPTITEVSSAMRNARIAAGAGEITKLAQTAASLSTMWGGVFGEKWDEARAMGKSITEAGDYAAASAYAEALPEMLGGGIPGMGGGYGTRLFKNMAQKTAEAFGGKAVGKVLPTVVESVAKFMGSEVGEFTADILGESVEEMITEAYTPHVLRNTIDPNAPDASAKQILEAGFIGGLQSLFMSGVTQTMKTARNNHIAYVPVQKGSAEQPNIVIEQMTDEELYKEMFGEEAPSVEQVVNSGISTPEEAGDAVTRLTESVYIGALLSNPTFEAVVKEFREGGKLYERYGSRISADTLESIKRIPEAVGSFLARTGHLSVSLVENLPSQTELDTVVEGISYALDVVKTGADKVGLLRDQLGDYLKGDVSDTDALNAFGKELSEEERVIDYYLTSDVIPVDINGVERMMSLPEYLDMVAKDAGLPDANAYSAEAIEQMKNELSSTIDSLSDEEAVERSALINEAEEISKLWEHQKQEAVADFMAERDRLGAEVGNKADALNAQTKASNLTYRPFSADDMVDHDDESALYRRVSDAENGWRDDVSYNPKKNNTEKRLIRNLTHEAEHVVEQKIKLADPTGKLLYQYDTRINNLGKRVGLDLDAIKDSVKKQYKLGDSIEDSIELADEMRAHIAEYIIGDSSALLDAVSDDFDLVNELLSSLENSIGGVQQRSKSERVNGKRVLEKVRAAVDGSLAERIEDQSTRVIAATSREVENAAKSAKTKKPQKGDSVEEAIALAEAELPPTSAKEAEEKAAVTEPVGEVFKKKQPELPPEAKRLGFKTSVDDQKKAPTNLKKKKVGNTEVSYADDATRVELAGFPGVYVRINQQTHKNGDVTRTLVAEADSTHPLSKNGKTRLFSDKEMKALHALGFMSKRGVWRANYDQSLWDSMASGNAEALRKGRRKAPENDIGDLHWYKTNRNDGSEVAWIPGNDGKGELVLIFRNNKGFKRGANKEEYFRYVGGERKGVVAPGLGFERRIKGAYGNALYAPMSEELWSGLGLPPMTNGMRGKMNDMTQIRRFMFAVDGMVACKMKGLEGYSLGFNSLNNTLELYDSEGSRVGSVPYSEGLLETVLDDSLLTEIFAEKSNDLQKLYDEAAQRKSEVNWAHTSPELEAKGDAAAEELGVAFAQAEPEAIQRSIERQLEKAEGKDVIWVKYRNSSEPQVFPRGIANELAGVSTGGKLKTAGDEYNGAKIYGPFVDPEYIDSVAEEYRIDPDTGMPRQLMAADVIEFIKDADGNMIWNASGYDPKAFYNSAVRSNNPNNPYAGIELNHEWFKNNEKYARAYERDLTGGVEKNTVEEKSIDEIFAEEKTKAPKAEVEAPSDTTEEEYGERLSGVLSDVEKRGALTAEEAASAKESYNNPEESGETRKESALAAEIQNDIREQKYAPKKKDIFKDADEGAKAMMELLAAEEEERRGTGMVIRPLYSYTMEEARQLCKGDSDVVILAKMEVSKTSEKMREAAAEKDWEVYKALKDKRAEQLEMLETIRSLKPTQNTESTPKVDLKDIIKPKKSKASKNEIDLAEGRRISAEDVEEGYEGSGKYGVGIKSSYGDYDPGALSEPVFNDSLVNSEGYPLRQDQKDIFNSMPGSLATDGSVQVYYTNYIDADGTEYGDGAFILGTDQSMIDGQSEAVYAAIRNPLFAETSKVSAYPGIRRTVTEALDFLGIDPKSVKLPTFRKEANVFDIIKTAADRASEISGINRSEIIGEILLQMGVDGIVYPDGAVVYDVEQLHQAYPESGETYAVNANYNNETSVTNRISPEEMDKRIADMRALPTASQNNEDVIRRSIAYSSNEAISSLRERVNALSDMREAYEAKYGKEAYRESVSKSINEAKEKYGTVDNRGAIPNKETEGKRKASKTAQNIWDSMEFDNGESPTRDAYEELIASGILNYTPETDVEHMAKAKSWLQSFATGTVENPKELTEEDFAQACRQWINRAESMVINEDDVYNGAQLLAEFANYTRANMNNPDAFSKGMLDAFQKIAALMDLTGSKLGKMLHAYKLIKSMNAQGSLYYYEHMADKIADRLDEAKGALRKNLKKHELRGYKVPEHLAKRLSEIKASGNSRKEMDDLETEIIKDIASKIPPTIESRVRAYRYLCMLGNLKTHARNMASNLIMAGVKDVARVNSALLEDVFASKAEGEERTKSLKKWVTASKEQKRAAKKFANEDAKRASEMLQFGGKQGFDDKVQQFMKSFGKSPVGRFLEAMSKKNGNWLETEDLIFLRKEYAAAMTWYMVANDWTPEHFYETTEQAAIDYSKAQDYALKQAWEATYRQSNILATKLNELSKSSPVANLLIEGIIPFKRTPLNILMAGINYSPVGIFNGIGKTIDMIKSGETSAAEAADTLGKGMSGSALMALGAFLAHFGLLKGGGSDDKAEEYYDQMIGNQKYSLSIPEIETDYGSFILGGKNYTVEWLTPVSMPLFAGVEAYEAYRQIREQDDDYDMRDLLNSLLDAVTATADPVTNLSMLSGVKNAVTTWQEGTSPLSIARNAGENYALQFIPTLSGQVLRTLDPTRRTTYAPSDSKMPGGQKTEVFWNKVKNKSLLANAPDLARSIGGAISGDGWDFDVNNQRYIDQWGRPEEGDQNVVARAIHQFAAPWYVRDYNSTEVDDNLAALYKKNGGDSKIFPETPRSYVSIGGTSYKYKGDEYEKAKTTVGKLSYKGVDSAFKYREFNKLDPSTQTDIIDSIYAYANEMQKIAYAKKKGLKVWKSDTEKKMYLQLHPNAKGFVQKSDVAKIETASKLGMSIGKYYTVKALLSGLSKYEKEAKLSSLGITGGARDLF